jgi:hypothetical protein
MPYSPELCYYIRSNSSKPDKPELNLKVKSQNLKVIKLVGYASSKEGRCTHPATTHDPQNSPCRMMVMG